MKQTGTLTLVIVLATVLGLGHHLDHMIRGNHVGWPLTPEITAFTVSLGFYPVIAIGYYLYRSGKAGPAFWSVLAAIGFIFVAMTHFGPLAVEPPQDILGAYDSPLVGGFAFSWLVAFMSTLGFAAIYAAYDWRRST